MERIKKDITLDIKKIVSPYFESKGFVCKGDSFFFVDDSGNRYEYEILASKNKGRFTLHLRLKLSNEILMKEVNKVLKNALLDGSYKYPLNWNDEVIKKSIKTRVADFSLAMVTDWRCFKKENESLEQFRERFSIWMCVFDDLNEIVNWENQLRESLIYAEEWFSNIGSVEWIIDNTAYPAMYLLKKHGRISELNEKYLQVLSKARSENEVKIFFKHLSMLKICSQ